MSRLLVFISFLLLISCQKATKPHVEIQTSRGNILVELYLEKAPVTVQNFLHLVEGGVYEGASFYRVVRMDNQPQSPVKIEVIQGGLKDDQQIEKYEMIEHETTDKTGVMHLDGTISMARMEPGTASTEFFICINDQPELDYGGKRNPDGQGFAAFGKVIKGMDVVRAIQQEADIGQMLDELVEIQRMVVQ